MRYVKRLSAVLAVLLLSMLFVACTEESQLDGNRKAAVQDREQNYEKAEALYPAPTDLTNFPMREALVKFTDRQDLVNHPWYIYVLALDGTPVGYYVGQTYPQSSCNFLSDTTRFVDLPDQQWGITSAPSYDGVFYGTECDTYFFFDMTTDAMYTFASTNWLASDQPLSLDTVALGATTIENVQATPAP